MVPAGETFHRGHEISRSPAGEQTSQQQQQQSEATAVDATRSFLHENRAFSDVDAVARDAVVLVVRIVGVVLCAWG